MIHLEINGEGKPQLFPLCQPHARQGVHDTILQVASKEVHISNLFTNFPLDKVSDPHHYYYKSYVTNTTESGSTTSDEVYVGWSRTWNFLLPRKS
jgi:hypothetical protein